MRRGSLRTSCTRLATHPFSLVLLYWSTCAEGHAAPISAMGPAMRWQRPRSQLVLSTLWAESRHTQAWPVYVQDVEKEWPFPFAQELLAPFEFVCLPFSACKRGPLLANKSERGELRRTSQLPERQELHNKIIILPITPFLKSLFSRIIPLWRCYTMAILFHRPLLRPEGPYLQPLSAPFACPSGPLSFVRSSKRCLQCRL